MLIYVSGPYTKNGNGKTQEENIRQARLIGCKLWEMGHAVIVPHENTSFFEEDCKVNYDAYIKGDLDMVSRCDALVMTEDWETSKGARIEKEYADALGIPVYISPNYPELSALEINDYDNIKLIREIKMAEYRSAIKEVEDIHSWH